MEIDNLTREKRSDVNAPYLYRTDEKQGRAIKRSVMQVGTCLLFSEGVRVEANGRA